MGIQAAYKVSTGMTPFRMVYGLEAIVPMEFVIPSLRVAIQHKLTDVESSVYRQEQLLKLDEDIIQAAHMTEAIQRRRQAWMDRNLKHKMFSEGDWVLLYNNKLGKRPGKLKLRYMGPF